MRIRFCVPVHDGDHGVEDTNGYRGDMNVGQNHFLLGKCEPLEQYKKQGRHLIFANLGWGAE